MKGSVHQKAKNRTRLLHKDRVLRKQERLAGLKDIYATFEQHGLVRAENVGMQRLHDKIKSVEDQLRVMGVDVSPLDVRNERR